MKNSLSFLGQLSDEDKLLAGRMTDNVRACGEKYETVFTFFLDEHQQALCKKVLASECFDNYLFWGGYEGAQRCVLGMFPPYDTVSKDMFPIKAVGFSFRKNDTLSHRDFLGCLMSLGIERNTVGDIVVSEGQAVAFVYKTVAPTVLMSEKVGRVGVKAFEFIEDITVPEPNFVSFSGTVASLRLDSVLSVALRLSREKSASLIRNGSVQVNHVVSLLADTKLVQGDVLSVKGYGKFVLTDVGSLTKKNRIHIIVNKYI